MQPRLLFLLYGIGAVLFEPLFGLFAAESLQVLFFYMFYWFLVGGIAYLIYYTLLP